MQLRRWQREALPRLTRAIIEGKLVLLSAPTGSGKTLLVLAAAIKTGMDITVFVRSKSQFQAWFRDAAKLPEEFTASFLVGQGDACQLAGGSLASPAPCDLCPLNRPLDRGPPTNKELTKPARYLRELIYEATSREACAYKTLISWASRSRLLVASYPYLLTANVRKVVDERIRRTLVVVDEAHNLDSASDEHSLTRSVLEKARRQALSREAKRVVTALLSLVREEDAWIETEKPVQLAGFSELLEEEARRIYAAMARREVVKTNYLKIVADFLEKIPDSRYKMYTGYGTVKLVDPDPATVVSILNEPPSAILLSATLPPSEYVRKVWGISREIVAISGKPGWGRRLEVVPPSQDLTTRYRERGESMWDAYAEKIRSIWSQAKKSLLVVCPSYQVAEEIAKRLVGLPTILESRDSRAEEVEEALRKNRSIVVAVARGKLVEGVEFRDEEGNSLLSDIVIAGVPYKQPDAIEEERAKRIAERAGLSGNERFLLLQLIPAWQAIAQAAGRAVRSRRDQAKLWLLDARFNDNWWKNRLTSLGSY